MATNTLGVYNPTFFANTALRILYKALGMAARVYMRFDEERAAFGLGDTINIRRPATFTAQSAPGSTIQDMATETVSVTLDQWKEVKFELPDDEAAFTGERIIEDHIVPAAFALADDVDVALAALYKDIPWTFDWSAPSVVSNITGVQQILFDNKVPLGDPSMMHFMIDGKRQAELLNLSAFTQHQGGAEAAVASQMRGALGMRYGLNFFANQNIQTHVEGTIDDLVLLTNGTIAKGDVLIDIDGTTVTGTLVPGDTFIIAGNTQRYAVTNTTTASSDAFASVGISPPAVQAYGDGVSVSVADISTDVEQNIAFHRNAFGFVTARLPDALPNQLGARVKTITDPFTGISLRSRMYYDGDNSKTVVSLDILYAVKTLDPNLAVRAMGIA